MKHPAKAPPHSALVARVAGALSGRRRVALLAWKRIPSLNISFGPLGVPGNHVKRRTQVKAAWDARRLYFHFQCESPDVEPLFTERDAPIFQEECVEIFLRIPRREDYWEFQGNSGSAIYDAHVPRFIANRLWRRWSRWNSKGLRYRATIQPGKGWQATWALLWEDLGLRVAPGMELEARLCRVADDSFLKQQELSCWPKADKCFDEPGTWGMLKLLD